MKGKYNIANIMIDSIDEATKEQIQGFLNHPAFGNTYIAIMPDVHAGAGAVVGFTMKMNDYVIPNVIGVDIGCSILSYKFKNNNISLEKLDEFIKSEIPSGFNINSNYKHILNNRNFYLSVIGACEKINIDFEKALRAIGSLGGGNHFIEAGIDSESNLWITVHSGSRNFGLKVAQYYQKLAKQNLEKYFIRDQYKNLEFLLTDSDDGKSYLFSLGVAQEFANQNRKEIMKRIVKFLDSEPIEIIESVHNYIGEDNIIRKGAVSARKGEKLVIPFNMRDGIAVCVGKGSAKYNYSAPHGAGRILSRTQAKNQLSLSEFEETMKGIYTTTANAETLDEAPMAYKDKDTIIDNIKETVDIIEMIKPIYNFKAGE
jgi:RNA-splicing ligase RtcB